MTSAEERQVAICLRKYNLKQIENEFAHHLSAIPNLSDEIKQQTLRTMEQLREAHSIRAEIKSLNMKNGEAKAKRERFRQECNKIIELGEKSQEVISELLQLIEQEEIDSSMDMKPCEAKLRTIINESRQSATIYDENMIRGETDKANKILSDLLAQEKICQNEVAEMKNILGGMKMETENIFEIIGKTELEEKLKSLN